MEFLLTSTSGEIEKQIPNTTIKKYTKREVRTCSTFEEFDKRFSRIEGTWLSKGVNHKASKGRIQREFPNGAEGYFYRNQFDRGVVRISERSEKRAGDYFCK